jgi:alpha-tubulin suppressor-like RCC1 family protein
VGAAAGAWHTVVWTAAGEVFACGDNSMGQLGHGEARQRSGLVAVKLPKGTSVKEVAAGGHHNLLLTKTGELYGWGHNAQGQLGLQKEENSQVRES